MEVVRVVYYTEELRNYYVPITFILHVWMSKYWMPCGKQLVILLVENVPPTKYLVRIID